MYCFSTYKVQYKSNLKLAIPIILTQLGQYLTQIADNVMVGQYGGANSVPLSAVSFGGTVFFILFIAAIGLALGMTPLIGALFVKDDRTESSQLLQNGILFYTALGLVIALFQYATIPLLYLFGQPTETVDMAIPYYKMLIYSMPFILFFFAFKQFLEGIGNTKMPMVVTIIANLANVGFNTLFIYGTLGCPEMGAEGAGLGTLLSRVMGAVLIVLLFYRRRDYRGYLDGFSLRRYSGETVKKLLRIGLPISLQMFLEASAFVGTSIMMGWFDKPDVIAANQIAGTIGNGAFLVVMSIGAATTIVVSHNFGRNDINGVALAAKASFHLVLLWNAFAALVFISLRKFIPMAFSENADAIAIAAQLLIFTSLYQLPDGLQNVSVGILRGLKDVKIIMPIAFVSYWVLNLPIGYLLAFKLGMGPTGLYVGFAFGLSTAAILLIWRIRHEIHHLRMGIR